MKVVTQKDCNFNVFVALQYIKSSDPSISTAFFSFHRCQLWNFAADFWNGSLLLFKSNVDVWFSLPWKTQSHKASAMLAETRWQS